MHKERQDQTRPDKTRRAQTRLKNHPTRPLQAKKCENQLMQHMQMNQGWTRKDKNGQVQTSPDKSRQVQTSPDKPRRAQTSPDELRRAQTRLENHPTRPLQVHYLLRRTYQRYAEQRTGCGRSSAGEPLRPLTAAGRPVSPAGSTHFTLDITSQCRPNHRSNQRLNQRHSDTPLPPPPPPLVVETCVDRC